MFIARLGKNFSPEIQKKITATWKWMNRFDLILHAYFSFIIHMSAALFFPISRIHFVLLRKRCWVQTWLFSFVFFRGFRPFSHWRKVLINEANKDPKATDKRLEMKTNFFGWKINCSKMTQLKWYPKPIYINKRRLYWWIRSLFNKRKKNRQHAKWINVRLWTFSYFWSVKPPQKI